MPWGALIGGAISIYGASKAKKTRNQDIAFQREMHEDQMGLARDQLDFGKQTYADWQEKFDPAFARMLNEVDQDLLPNYGQIAGDIKSSFQSQRGQEGRAMMRYGIKPSDGAYFDRQRKYGINEAAAHVGVRSQARESKRGLKFERMQNISNMLVGMQGTPASIVNSGFSNSINAMGQSANMFGDQANMRYRQGMNNAAGIGQAIGGIDWGGIWGDVKGWFGGSSSSPGP